MLSSDGAVYLFPVHKRVLSRPVNLVDLSDQRAFLGITLQVLPFLFLAAVLEVRTPASGPVTDEHEANSKMSGAAVIFVATLATVAGSVAAIAGLLHDPVRTWQLQVAIVALFANGFAVVTAVFSGEWRRLVIGWRDSSRPARRTTGVAIVGLVICSVLLPIVVL